MPRGVQVFGWLLLALVLAGCTTTRQSHRPDEIVPIPPEPPQEIIPQPAVTSPPPPSVVVTNKPVSARPRYVVPAGVTWVPLDSWLRSQEAPALRLAAKTPPTFTIAATSGRIQIRHSDTHLRWNGEIVMLGFAPRMERGVLQVHRLDVEKVIIPLLMPLKLPPAGERSIVIDPGHGGRDSGAVSVFNRRNEKEYTLDWARRLAPLLKQQGWNVHLTRTNDVEVAVSNRVVFAEQRKADLFLSLHFNSAAPVRERSGCQSFLLTPTGMPSSFTREFEDDPRLAFPNNSWDTRNLQYAVRLHRAILGVAGRDAGVEHARFMGVLRGQNRPAVLLEGGYLSNPAEASRIADPAYRQKLAEAVAGVLK